MKCTILALILLTQATLTLAFDKSPEQFVQDLVVRGINSSHFGHFDYEFLYDAKVQFGDKLFNSPKVY